MITTWPVLTEAMYLLGDAGGWKAQNSLWTLLTRGDLVLDELDEELLRRSRSLMQKYSDRPMSLADATLLAVAEKLGVNRIFTLDSDFDFHRRRGGRERFERVP